MKTPLNKPESTLDSSTCSPLLGARVLSHGTYLRRILILVGVLAALGLGVTGCGDDGDDDEDDVTDMVDTGDDADAEDMDEDGDVSADADTDGSDDMADMDAADEFELGPWDPDPACTQVIRWGEQDETAIREIFLEATTGDIICFSPGPFRFTRELSLTVDGVEVRGDGMGETILNFAGQESGSNGLFVRANDFTVADLTVKNTPGDAIRVEGTVTQFAENIQFLRVEVTWDGGSSVDNGAYGLYPVLTRNTLIDGCVASYASDAGIYVGQSENVIVRNSEAYGNVAGIEIENTTGAEVHDNHAHDNTGGLLIFDLPDKPIQGGNNTLAYNNLIENNNTENFAPSGNIVAQVPTGTGVLILASDSNELRDNTIRGNGSTGILTVSYFLVEPNYAPDCADEEDNDGDTFVDLDDPDCDDEFDDSEEEGKAPYDPYPENNHFHDNVMEDNGQQPSTIPLITVILTLIGEETFEDNLWDGVVSPYTMPEEKNCWNNNVDSMDNPATWRNLDAENDFENSTTDPSAGGYDCVGITVPPVTLP